MSNRIIILMTCACLLLMGAAAQAVDVTLRVVDQYGVDIPYSFIQLGGTAYPTGTVLSLTEGGYTTNVFPGLGSSNGRADGLARPFTFTVDASTTEAAMEWLTATFPVEVLDQHGNLVTPPYGTYVYFGTHGNQGVANGTVITMPITDESVYPDMTGEYINGYDVEIAPGALRRTMPPAEVDALTTEWQWEWLTATFPVEVLDQHGNLVTPPYGTYVYFGTHGNQGVANGTVITMPITDESVYPDMTGEYINGYDVEIAPGALRRTMPPAEVDALTTEWQWEWLTATLPVKVVDQYGIPVNGSWIAIGSNGRSGIWNGTIVTLPVTDETVYPSMTGTWADGYDIYVAPGFNNATSADSYRLKRYDGLFEITASTSELSFEWIQTECAFQVVDDLGQEIPSSHAYIYGAGSLYNGNTVRLPITDNVVYPTLQGLWTDGYPIEIFPGGTSVGTATFEVTGALEFDPPFVTLGDNQYGLRCIPPEGSVDGYVTADCPAAGTALFGVHVDAFALGTGDLVASATTDASGYYLLDPLPAGDYTITIVTPLGYTAGADEIAATVPGGEIVAVNFALSCVEIIAEPRAIGFWKHQVGVAMGGRGAAQIDAATLCQYLDLIAAHFNGNALNQVVVYDPPMSDLCIDKLAVASDLLNLRGNVGMVTRARQQLVAVLLNVVSGMISQSQVVSVDGANLSQAITFCDQLIDNPSGNYERAKTICNLINSNIIVPAGMIPLSTPNIAYKAAADGPLQFCLHQSYPNPFNAQTTISFALPTASDVRLEIYNIVGQRVAVLVDAYLEAGEHTVRWDGSAFASGDYLFRFAAGEQVATRKMLLLK